MLSWLGTVALRVCEAVETVSLMEADFFADFPNLEIPNATRQKSCPPIFDEGELSLVGILQLEYVGFNRFPETGFQSPHSTFSSARCSVYSILQPVPSEQNSRAIEMSIQCLPSFSISQDRGDGARERRSKNNIWPDRFSPKYGRIRWPRKIMASVAQAP